MVQYLYMFYVQRLYKLGARKVVMFELGPIGCVPSITRHFKHNGQCVEDINHLINLFNAQLRTTLTTLTSTLEGSAFVLGHANGLGYDAIINPTKYGNSYSRLKFNSMCTSCVHTDTCERKQYLCLI